MSLQQRSPLHPRALLINPDLCISTHLRSVALGSADQLLSIPCQFSTCSDTDVVILVSNEPPPISNFPHALPLKYAGFFRHIP